MTAGLAFRRGWVGSSRALPSHDVTDRWEPLRCREVHLRVHPALARTRVERDDASLVFLGMPVDVEEGTTDARRVAGSVLTAYTRGGERAAVRSLAYLGGRFTCLLATDDEVLVVPDCAGSLPTSWHQDASGGVTIGSHTHLVAEVAGAAPDEEGLALWRHLAATRTRGTLYWPGVRTPFAGVSPLLPNHLLRWRGARRPRHERFYPFPDRAEVRREEADERFAHYFAEHTRLLCSTGRRVGISLTGGRDSMATLVAALPHLGADAFTWTYGRADDRWSEDLRVANRRAYESGLRHRLVPLEASTDPDFTEAYTRTFRYTPQHRRLAGAYFDAIPPDVLELQSMVAEVGTGFYKQRTGTPTPETLARLYASGNQFATHPGVLAAMESYLTYADFSVARFHGVDFHDLFYWETRIGLWGALRMQEVDLSHELALPFNQRHVIEALQAPPLEERVDKQALDAFIERRSLAVTGSAR